MKTLNIQSIGISLSAITASFFLFSLFLPKVFVSQQYADCAGYTFKYNECERGNATACRYIGVNNVAGVYQNAAGAYCCTNTGQVCNGGVSVTTNNGSGGSIGGGKISTITTAPAQPNAYIGMACGVNGTGKCETQASAVYSGYGGAACDSSSKGVCSYGNHGYVCCTQKPVNATVSLVNKSNNQVNGDSTSRRVLAAQAYVISGTVNYDAGSGSFSNPAYPISNVPAGDYLAILQVQGHLAKQLTNSKGDVFSITSGQKTLAIDPITPIAGDVAPYPNGDNYVDLQDYNYIMGCLNMKDSDTATAACPNPRIADLNKDGVVDQRDISVVASAFGKKGNYFADKQSLYTCVTDPTCAKNGDSMQLCTLKCTKNQ